jgi:hypothetical protein
LCGSTELERLEIIFFLNVLAIVASFFAKHTGVMTRECVRLAKLQSTMPPHHFITSSRWDPSTVWKKRRRSRRRPAADTVTTTVYSTHRGAPKTEWRRRAQENIDLHVFLFGGGIFCPVLHGRVVWWQAACCTFASQDDRRFAVGGSNVSVCPNDDEYFKE